MARYRVVFDEDLSDYEEDFDTEEEAREYGDQLASEYMTGCETLFLSNRGDSPMPETGIDYDIVEIED